MQVYQIDDKRFEVGVELLLEGQSLTFQGVDLWLNKLKGILEIRLPVNWSGVSEEKAWRDFKKAKDVLRYLEKNSSSFSKATRTYTPRYSLISDYGTGAVEICHLSEEKIVWT